MHRTKVSFRFSQSQTYEIDPSPSQQAHCLLWHTFLYRSSFYVPCLKSQLVYGESIYNNLPVTVIAVNQ